MQIDGFRQAHERLGNISGGVSIATRQQVGLDRKLETSIDKRRLTGEALLEFSGTAICRHRERARQSQAFSALPVLSGIANDGAHHLFERLGFKTTSIVMMREE